MTRRSRWPARPTRPSASPSADAPDHKEVNRTRRPRKAGMSERGRPAAPATARAEQGTARSGSRAVASRVVASRVAGSRRRQPMGAVAACRLPRRAAGRVTGCRRMPLRARRGAVVSLPAGARSTGGHWETAYQPRASGGSPASADAFTGTAGAVVNLPAGSRAPRGLQADRRMPGRVAGTAWRQAGSRATVRATGGVVGSRPAVLLRVAVGHQAGTQHARGGEPRGQLAR